MIQPVIEMTNHSQGKRIQSIDFLRGLVMVFMALDHSRTFLHASFYEFNAEDLAKTTPILFFTRWITHFCAPVFIFLTGTSAYLMNLKLKSKKQVSNFLISRGLVLIFLELTLFRFCWDPTAPFFRPFVLLLVIWALGVSMIFLGLIIFLPFRAILIFGFAVLFIHNTLAGVHFENDSAMGTLWAFFYSGGSGLLFGNVRVVFLYPILPYFGLISLGYCFGYLYGPGITVEDRRKYLIRLGLTSILIFIVLRYFNIYGDPHPWVIQKNGIFSVMSFLKTTKYPISLLYTLMTLGPCFLILAWVEPVKNVFTGFFVTIGSVPMFYYVLHLLLFVTIGFTMGFNSHSLASVYAWFVFVVIILYSWCRWYSNYKFHHREKKWLRYI